MICIAKTKEIADEFRRVCEFASRGSWSNSARFGQAILAKIYQDPELLAKVDEERAYYRDMLLAREERSKKKLLQWAWRSFRSMQDSSYPSHATILMK